MRTNPRRRAGDTTGQGRAIGPARRNRSVGGRFRVPPFFARRQNRFDETRRPGRSVLPFDTGRFGIRCRATTNWRQVVQRCVTSGKVARSRVTSPPNVRRWPRLDLHVGQLGNRRESPEAGERPEAAVAAASWYVEVGGSGGYGWMGIAASGQEAGQRRRGKPQRRVSVRPAGGEPR